MYRYFIFIFHIDKPDKTIIDFSPDPAVLGKRAVITCVSNGRPKPRHVITHNGSVITNEPVEKEFVIFPVFWNTTGIYQCIARNKLGQKPISSCLKVVSKGETYIYIYPPVLFAFEIIALPCM